MTVKKMSQLGLGMLAGVAIITASPAQANVISNFTTIFNSDWTTAGTGGLRDGTGTITVSGVSGSVGQSMLFWQGPTNTTNADVMANITINGNAVTGTNIGFSDDNFWGFQNGQAYRADTSAQINGNGAYTLAGFNTANSTGNGAAAAVFFNDGDSTNNRDIVIFNGNDSNFDSIYDPAGWNLTLSGINYTSGQAFLRLFVSDGQNFGSNDDGTLQVNGTSIATGGIFQGDTLPGESVGNGNLFDIRSFEISSLLSPGLNSVNLTLDAGFNDALSVIAAFIDLPAGAAPPTGTVPEPGTLGLLAVGLIGLLARRRKLICG